MDRRVSQKFSTFTRNPAGLGNQLTAIGTGELGGKAQGLACIQDIIEDVSTSAPTPGISVTIPPLTVITTQFFDEFMQQNHLYEVAYSDLPDYLIAHKFQQADLPVMMLGDLHSLIRKIRPPLAIRSSSLLEDAMHEPFAGIYGTKMIPNNHASPDTRFQKLVEAIKFIYASTFFKQAKEYLRGTRHAPEDEKMAVIIQEVVGLPHGDLFYPNISGVARSYNFYATGKAKPEDGVVNLALGLGKTIVDGDPSWFYSPAYPKVFPPYASTNALLKQTQIHFWAVNLRTPFEYDPTKETEYLTRSHIAEADQDGALAWIASTYDGRSDRLSPGARGRGPRVLTFAPILHLKRLLLNDLIQTLLARCKEALGCDVEIEFAMTFEPGRSLPANFGFLQVRPTMISHEQVEISPEEFVDERLVTASDTVLGNGCVENIRDIVYVKPDAFDSKHTRTIAADIARINTRMLEQGRPYLLIGFGRWGSTDPWLGIPVDWGQINGAKVIVEATLPQMHPDLSQGSHFFHNITSYQVLYFSVKYSGQYPIAWDWLNGQERIEETALVNHITLPSPLTIKADGRTGRGVILRALSRTIALC